MNLNHFNFDNFDHVTELVKGVQRKGRKITFKLGEETTSEEEEDNDDNDDEEDENREEDNFQIR